MSKPKGLATSMPWLKGPKYGTRPPTPRKLAETLRRQCSHHLREHFNYGMRGYEDTTEVFDVSDPIRDSLATVGTSRSPVDGGYSFLIRAWRGGALLWTADVIVTPTLDVIVNETLHSKSYKPRREIFACLSATYGAEMGTARAR